MRKVLTLICLLAVAHHVAAQCNVPSYSLTFVPECAPKDVYVKWPNYENQATYYECNGPYNPVLTSCPSGQVFTFVLQICTDCSQYIQPVQCTQLKTQDPPKCIPIGPGFSTVEPVSPTPSSSITPSSTSATTQSSTSTVTVSSSETSSASSSTVSAITPPTENSNGSSTPGIDISPPPSPVSNNPDIPLPSTPGPTPPSISIAPPDIPAPPTIG